jgi:tRNA(fMet)-specific endonuclease VapC
MGTVVLDTNLVSYRMKDHTTAALYRRHLAGQTLAISFMTVAELYEGAHRKGWGLAKMVWLEEELEDYQVLHSTAEMARLWGAIRAGRRQQPIAVDDAWIAATALANGYALVTHNPDDFREIEGLQVITEHIGGKKGKHA